MQKMEQFWALRTRFLAIAELSGYCSYRNPTVTRAPNFIELKRSVTHDYMPNMVENGQGVQKLFSDKRWTHTHTDTQSYSFSI